MAPVQPEQPSEVMVISAGGSGFPETVPLHGTWLAEGAPLLLVPEVPRELDSATEAELLITSELVALELESA